MGTPDNSSSSPPWSPTIKTIVGLSIAAIIIALLATFRNVIGPLLLAFILAYLIHPLAKRLKTYTRLSWRTCVTLTYVLLIVVLLAILSLSGLAIVQQVQNLVTVVEHFFSTLPDLFANLANKVYSIGPYQLDLSKYDLPTLGERVLSTIQPLLGQVGSLVSSFATSAVTTFIWIAFVLIISYFLVVEATHVSANFFLMDIPGYNADLRHMMRHLTMIWDAFLRGQLIIALLTVISYYILMTILGMRLAFAIAILAGLARFVPYIGPIITWIVILVVALLTPNNIFGLLPWQYALLAAMLGGLLDQIYDNLVVPRIMGNVLGLHPAAVLVAAIIAAKLMGLIGLVLAAPVLATILMICRYAFRKILDMDPWPPGHSQATKRVDYPWARLVKQGKEWWQSRRKPAK